MKPKLTLRDLFWLVLVCAMALGWWVDRTGLDREWRKRWDFVVDNSTKLLEEYNQVLDERDALRQTAGS